MAVLNNLTKKQKKTLIRIVISLVLFAALLIMEHTGVLSGFGSVWVELIPYLAVYLIVGYDVVIKAAKNISHGQVFDENFLMLVATVAAFFIGEYSEAVAVMLFYQVGELFQSYAVGRSRQSISELMDIVPEYANIEKDGALVQIDPDEIEPGMIITVKPGERIPLDGKVIDGESMIDTSSLTGESVPRRVCPGSELISGCINGSGTLKAEVTKAFEDSTVTRILELVENAGSKKAQVENFITRFAKYYTPVVTICAVILAIIPPLVLGGTAELFGDWIKRACIFLVISCPCALVISVPLGFFGGIGAASRCGVLVKGGNYLEAVSRVRTVVFDKTGTLTKGEFKVSGVIPRGCTKEVFLKIAAMAEGYSDHPIAVSIRSAYENESHSTVDLTRVTSSEEMPGLGIHAVVNERDIYIGNLQLMHLHGIEPKETDPTGTVVYLAERRPSGMAYMGAAVISDGIKEASAPSIAELKALGVRKCVMLTGDIEGAAKAVSDTLGLDEYHAGLLPADKVELVEKLLTECENGEKLAFVGDGINDAPVLSRADVGIAMGSMGSDAAIEAADIVIMDDDTRKIPVVINIASRTMRIVKQNIVFALAVKLIVMVLGALGLANMWIAVFADVGVSVIAILNSMRALRIKRTE